MTKIIIPVSGGIDSCYLLWSAQYSANFEIYPVEFDDGNMDHIESRTARLFVEHARQQTRPAITHPMTSLAIPKLDLLKVQYPIEHATPTQARAMQDIPYWSGFKALFYATTLAFGGAIGASEVQWGTQEWNDHFLDEYPSFAQNFRNTWASMYPDLDIPMFMFPLMGKSKVDIVYAASKMHMPFERTWSCFGDGPHQCGRCLGCQQRQEAFHQAKLIDFGAPVYVDPRI
jgi:7-cyano-7-deazaguanine synthase